MRSTNLKIYWLFLFWLLCNCASITGKYTRKSDKFILPYNEPIPEDFVILPSSKDVLNHPNCYKIWEVFQEGDATKIREQSRLSITVLPFKIDRRRFSGFSRHIQQVDDGWLIGFDGGEFGGGLSWFSPDGSREKGLIGENVRGLVKSSTGFFVASGLQHLGLSRGKIFHVKKGVSGNWKADLLVDFRANPHTFTQESPDSLLVVVGPQSDLAQRNGSHDFGQKTGGIFRVKASGKVEPVLTSGSLGYQPNSMTLSKSGIIYLGAWRYVTRLTPVENGYKEETFVPLNCY
jgi:hypothetical protein